MRRVMLAMSICLLIGACTAAGRPPAQPATRAAPPTAILLPAMKGFGPPRPVPPQRANRDIAQDFLDLAFEMESGRKLTYFSRFEGPITVRVTGAAPVTLTRDLDRLLHRLRTEAGIDIRRVTGETANITIAAVRRDEIRRTLPSAACFVVPNIDSLDAYRSTRSARATDWTRIRQRERIAIFLPSDASLQEARDCLHEELAQAIGPLNDLYRLPDSVFNDDNMHAVLTGFDMLILRAYYAPDLRTGMTRDEVAARLPALLARLNPGGERIAPNPLSPAPRAWIVAIQTALGPDARAPARRAAARDAVRIAQALGWTDHRRAFSHLALGRVMQGRDPDFAETQFLLADHVYRGVPGTELHRAYVGAQLAGHAIARGDGAGALARLEPLLIVAERFENAALLATLLRLQAEALDLEGRTDAAQVARLDSLGWARYGYGVTWLVQTGRRDARGSGAQERADKDG